MKYHYIYKITCTAGSFKNKFYFGKHSTENLDDGYKGSGMKISAYYKKYPNDYVKEIILFCENEDELNKKEYDIIHPWLNHPMCLNLMEGGHGGAPSVETRLKISQTNKEVLKGNSNRKNIPCTDIAKKNISIATKKAMKNVVLWNKGRHGVYSEETLRSISKSLIGNKNAKGCKHSEESRKRQGLHQKGRKAWNKGKTGRKFINNGIINKYVFPEELNNYINNGWVLGRLKNSTKDTVYINNGYTTKRIPLNELNDYIKDGWSKGRQRHTA